jgi:hypothetical protein
MEKEHTLYCMPYRVLRKLVIATDWSWETRAEYGAVVYGDRESKATITCGVVRRGTPKGAEVKIAGNRRSILMFHNHPPGNFRLPSTGDIEWVLWFHDYRDKRGTFEAFAIGMPDAKDEGRITFYMVTDWDYMREVFDKIKEANWEYRRYLRGERPDAPSEIYDAQYYLWKRLHLFTRRRTLDYHPPIEVPKVEIAPEEVIEPYVWDDVVKAVELMKRFPEMEMPF